MLKHKISTSGIQLYYAATDEFWPKEQKYTYLEAHGDYTRIDWQALTPNTKHTWLTEGLHDEFETFLPMGTKKGKRAKEGEAETIFKLYSNGVKTNRDVWVINLQPNELANNIQRMITVYNDHLARWKHLASKPKIDDFILNDSTQISWSSTLKNKLKARRVAIFDKTKIRHSLYRPFTKSSIYFDRILIDRAGQFPRIFPTPESEAENRVICLTAKAAEKPFTCLMTNTMPNLVVCGGFGAASQCFPFYTYNEDGTNRQENITDWALVQFRAHYDDLGISKWHIFYYVYALLHHPDYRETYAQNLKRALPHIPYAPDFHAFAQAGAELSELHLHYEAAEVYPLTEIDNPDVPMTYRVEKMRLGKSKTSLRVNDFLTLAGIPPATYEYTLGNRSALHWVIDQYRVKTDKRSGIINDPNNNDDPEYIIRLIGQMITVSLETVRIVATIGRLPFL